LLAGEHSESQSGPQHVEDVAAVDFAPISK
jgi:hypothetical protein